MQDGGATAFSEIQFDIVLNCMVESLVPPASLPDVTYTFHAAQLDSVILETVSTFPLSCLVAHHLQIFEGGSWVTLPSSSLLNVLAYVEATRTLSVFYDTDNEFSPLDTPNTYQMKIVADLDNQGTITNQQSFNLILVKDCSFATLTVNTANSVVSYTVNSDNFANTFTMSDFTISDSFCSFTYGLSEYTTDANSNTIRDDAEYSVVS